MFKLWKSYQCGHLLSILGGHFKYNKDLFLLGSISFDHLPCTSICIFSCLPSHYKKMNYAYLDSYKDINGLQWWNMDPS
jgi:hypothetical protein